jgi:hypothetical protein
MYFKSQNSLNAGHKWLTPVVLATWEAKIERIVVPHQPRQKVCETPSQSKLGSVVCTCHAKLCRRLKSKRITVSGKPK